MISKLITGLKSTWTLIKGIGISWKTSAASAIVYQAALEGVNVTTISSTFAQLSLMGKIKAVALALKEQAAAFMATPIGWISVAAVAIFGLVKVVDWATTSTEEWKEKLSQTKQALEDLKSEAETLNDELKTTQQRILELEGKESLTFTEEAELKRLREENAELQRKIDLNDILQKQANKENNKTFVSTMKSDLEDPFEYEIDPDGKSTYVDDAYLTNEKKYIEYQFEQKKKLYDELAQLEQDYLDGKISKKKYDSEKKRIDKEIKETSKYLTDKQKEFTKNAADIEYIPNPTTDDEKAVNAWLDYINEFNDKYIIAMGNTAQITNLWSDILNRPKFAEARTEIEKLAEVGNLTAESLQNLYNQGGNVKEFIDYILSLDTVDWKTILGDDFDRVAKSDVDDGIVSTTEALAWMNENGENSAKIMSLFANELNKVEDAAEGATNSALSLSQIYEKLKEKVDPLAKAYEEMTESGELSADTLFNLLKSHKDLIKYIEIENGQYKIKKSLLEDEFKLQRKLRIEELERARYNILHISHNNDREGKMGPFPLGTFIEDLKRAEEMSKEIAILKNLDIDDFSGGSKKSPIEENKEAAEKYFAELKYKLETNKITQEEYLKTLDKEYKDFYNKTADYLEDYAKYSQEVYDGFKDMYKEDLEAQKEAWEEKKDAVSEYYDNLREQIEDAHDKEDYEKEQSEKRKEIFDLDMQIAELMRDGSEKAKARIAELEEERLKAEEELLDFETDKAREDEISRLEKEQEAEEKKIQGQIDGIQGQLDQLDKDTVSVRNAIIAYAKEKGVTLKFAYASGTRSSVGGFGRINEKGIEMISAPDGNGNYIPMLPNSHVFSAKATEFLWKLATEHSLPQAMYNSIAKSIKTQSNTPSVNIAQPISITMGDVIIKGNADKQTVADIKKQQENTVRMVLQKIKELQK